MVLNKFSFKPYILVYLSGPNRIYWEKKKVGFQNEAFEALINVSFGLLLNKNAPSSFLIILQVHTNTTV